MLRVAGVEESKVLEVEDMKDLEVRLATHNAKRKNPRDTRS